MSIKYKIDVLKALKEKGYSAYALRQNSILGQSTIQKLRNKEAISWNNISTICDLLECKLDDVLEYVKD